MRSRFFSLGSVFSRASLKAAATHWPRCLCSASVSRSHGSPTFIGVWGNLHQWMQRTSVRQTQGTQADICANTKTVRFSTLNHYLHPASQDRHAPHLSWCCGLSYPSTRKAPPREALSRRYTAHILQNEQARFLDIPAMFPHFHRAGESPIKPQQ